MLLLPVYYNWFNLLTLEMVKMSETMISSFISELPLKNIQSITSFNKGWSSDRKFIVVTEDMMILNESFQIGTKNSSLPRLIEDEISSSSTKQSWLSLRISHPQPKTKNALKSSNDDSSAFILFCCSSIFIFRPVIYKEQYRNQYCCSCHDAEN